ncbi:RadC family protein [Paenibacillus odorifer]|uniref:RadC family protein n=1 Tax=Paenibacillus odorifer TaxID=189426 RepID=UPI00273E0661|nr:DNA repair protein RadC [Paenibacillus odorifer]
MRSVTFKVDSSNRGGRKVLLANTLCEKSEGYVMEQLFNRYSTLSELLDVTEHELLTIKGIGKAKSRQILSALQLARALNATTQQVYTIGSPKDAADLMMPELAYLQREHFVLLFLNTKNRVIGKEVIAIGSLDSAIVHPREVYKAAVKRSSAAIIAVHNHPSGDPTPSREDIALTERLVNAGEIMGVQLLDHLIIANENYCSMKERGLM